MCKLVNSLFKMLQCKVHRRMIGNSHIVPPHKVVKTTKSCKLHSRRPHNDDKRSRKTFPQNHRRVVEIKLYIALRVTIILHHFGHILHIAAKIHDRTAWILIFVVVCASNERRTEDYVVCSIRVSFDPLKKC